MQTTTKTGASNPANLEPVSLGRKSSKSPGYACPMAPSAMISLITVIWRSWSRLSPTLSAEDMPIVLHPSASTATIIPANATRMDQASTTTISASFNKRNALVFARRSSHRHLCTMDILKQVCVDLLVPSHLDVYFFMPCKMWMVSTALYFPCILKAYNDKHDNQSNSSTKKDPPCHAPQGHSPLPS